MSWWQNPGLPGISVDPSLVKLPVELELIPDLINATVDLIQVTVGSQVINCWTYQTKGLVELGQKEIVFALRQEPNQLPGNFPAAPLDFFKNVADYVVRGEYLDAGSITTFGESGFLSSRFKAIGYVEPPVVADAHGGASIAWAVLLTENELEGSRTAGLSRIVSLLGKENLHFPCPSWNDLNRHEVVSDAMLRGMQESPVSQFPRMPLHSACASRVGEAVECMIPRSAQSAFAQLADVDEDVPLALLLGLDPTADSVLVWQLDFKTPLAITAPGFPGDRLGGVFVCFIPEQDNDLGLVSDDGFAFSLTMDSWRKIRAALMSGQPCTIPATLPGFSLRISWFDDVEVQVLLARREERKAIGLPAIPSCKSAAAAEKSTVPARAVRVELRTHEADIDKLIEAPVLSAYIQRLEDVVRDHFFYEGPSEGFDLTIEVVLKPVDTADFRISSKPVMEADDELAVVDRLSLMFPPTIKEGAIEFSMEFAVWGGEGALSAGELE